MQLLYVFCALVGNRTLIVDEIFLCIVGVKSILILFLSDLRLKRRGVCALIGTGKREDFFSLSDGVSFLDMNDLHYTSCLRYDPGNAVFFDLGLHGNYRLITNCIRLYRLDCLRI